jgi:plastocyanin
MRRALVVASLLLASAALRADVVTLPAAASIQGGNPFFSDVRVFNTSYSENLAVTATYRCFIAGAGAAGGACPSPAPVLQINLAPRESKAFDDMVASADGFNAHDTAGGVEFEFSGAEDQLVVTSRLFSTFPQNSVGMFIPGLDESDAHPTTVLTSIRHNPGNGVGTFRTNVGVFNPEDGATNVTFTIFDGGTNQLGSGVVRNVPGHSGVQVSGIFEAAGAGGASTENAVIVVSADSEVFSYAAVLDNNTADPIFVVGAEDQPQQPITPVPVTAVATATPTSPAGPTPTPTPPAGIVANVNVGGDGLVFTDVATGTHTTTIHVGDTVHWVWQGGPHSSTSDTGVWDSGINSQGHVFDRQFTSAGNFPYHCLVHGQMMSGTVVVNP